MEKKRGRPKKVIGKVTRCAVLVCSCSPPPTWVSHMCTGRCAAARLVRRRTQGEQKEAAAPEVQGRVRPYAGADAGGDEAHGIGEQGELGCTAAHRGGAQAHHHSQTPHVLAADAHDSIACAHSRSCRTGPLIKRFSTTRKPSKANHPHSPLPTSALTLKPSPPGCWTHLGHIPRGVPAQSNHPAQDPCPPQESSLRNHRPPRKIFRPSNPPPPFPILHLCLPSSLADSGDEEAVRQHCSVQSVAEDRGLATYLCRGMVLNGLSRCVIQCTPKTLTDVVRMRGRVFASGAGVACSWICVLPARGAAVHAAWPVDVGLTPINSVAVAARVVCETDNRQCVVISWASQLPAVG